MNRKEKQTEQKTMSTWEVIRRLVRDAKPIYGWLLLGALSFGIGYLWILPYMDQTFTNFYLSLRQE